MFVDFERGNWVSLYTFMLALLDSLAIGQLQGGVFIAMTSNVISVMRSGKFGPHDGSF